MRAKHAWKGRLTVDWVVESLILAIGHSQRIGSPCTQDRSGGEVCILIEWVVRCSREVPSPVRCTVFHAETHSVEDYLKQVEESTILSAIQVRPPA